MVVLKRRLGRVSFRFVGSRNKFLLFSALTLLAAAAWLTNSNQGPVSQQFFVASRDLPKSTELDSSTVSVVEIQMNDVKDKYFSANQNELGNWFLTKPVLAGELIPLSAISSTKEANCTPIILTLDSMLPTAIKIGSDVDIWAAQQSSSIESMPHEVALSAELIGIKVDNDGIGQANQSIEVCVSVAEVRSVVDAIAKNSTVVAVKAFK